MTPDRRQSARSHVLRRGRIVFGRGYSAIDCVVLDLSETGAKVKVAEWLGLPKSFELRIENAGVRVAEVRYRGLDAAGVEFV